MRHRVVNRLLIAACSCVLLGTSLAAHGDVLVAAASSIRDPLNAIVTQFTGETGIEVRVSYGASGRLTQQILRGAPYEIFLSADEAFPKRLRVAEAVRKGPTLYALGRLVMYAPLGSSVDAGKGLDGFRESLTRGDLRHVALAHPELAPYGRAADQVLRAAGLLDMLNDKIVVGNNVAQAAQFAVSGSVDVAFVSLSLALALNNKGNYYLLPESMHRPLRHAMVLLNRAGPDAFVFFDFLSEPKSRETFQAGGFDAPADG